MGAFDLAASFGRAERRLGVAGGGSKRRERSDRGRSRLDPRVLEIVRRAFSTQERPAMTEALADIARSCRRLGRRPPSRATAYALLDTIPSGTWRVADLPHSVRAALYNLDDSSDVPGHQLAFYCFNYGDLAAVCFASGLPWLALHQALRLPGFRAKSRGLLEAAARVRGIRS